MLVAKFHNDVVGLLLASYYPERRKAIVGYYGINRELVEARRFAGNKLLPKLHKILMHATPPCEYLFLDLQGVDPATPKKEASERKARPVRFKQSAKRLVSCNIIYFVLRAEKTVVFLRHGQSIQSHPDAE